jgi:hypothetical protein
VFDGQQAGIQRQQTSHAAVMCVDERGLTLVVVLVGWAVVDDIAPRWVSLLGTTEGE